MTALLETSRPSLAPGDRVTWTDPAGKPQSGRVVATNTDSLLVAWDCGIQKPIPWSAEGLQLEAGSTPLPGMDDYAARHNPGLLEVPLSEVRPSTLNPRRVRDDDVTELAEDIRRHGLINPVSVRELAGTGPRYEVISGERRFRACRVAGLQTVTVINRGPLSEADAYRETIRENAQRRDLSPLEEAAAIHQMESFGWTQDVIAQLLGGKSQSWVSRTKALLGLPAQVQQALTEARLSRTQAEELLTLGRWPKEQVRLAEDAERESWTAARLAEVVAKRKRSLEDAERLPLEEEPAPAPQETQSATQPETEPEWPRHDPSAAVVLSEETVQAIATETDAPDLETSPRAEAPTAPTPAAQVTAPATTPAPETPRPGALKTAAEIVAERAGQTVPTTVGSAPPPAPMVMCPIPTDARDWLAADGFTTGPFLVRLKAAAYNRGLTAAAILEQLEAQS